MNDFRLAKDIRPSSYELRFELDLETWTARGEETITLRLPHPARSLTLHAVDLEIATGDGIERVSYDSESQTATLELAAQLPAGEHRVRIHWTGGVAEKLRGLYRSTRPGERYAATQFEAADARRAFPCFDEPEFKARFTVTLVHASGLAAIANAPIRESRQLPDGRTETAFAATPVISPYLVAFTVGPYESTPAARTKTGHEVRVWLPPGLAAQAIYARDAHVQAVEYLEEYTGIPYPYTKVDAIGIPDFEAGAMENPGAITYRTTLLAADTKTASTPTFKAVFSVAAHELTHMWWGDLVTMAWWNDLWLNESFASFVGGKCTATLNPEWGYWRDVVAQNTTAFDLDALVSTHPISMEAKSVDEANERFDAVTYLKGQGVLRMIENYLGEDAFRAGVRVYLDRFRERNATANDFWRALDEASARDVTKVANAWITEPGHPLVSCSVRETAAGLTVELRQQRFVADPAVADTGQRWPIPVVFRYGTTAGVAEHRILFDGDHATIDLPGARWYYPNAAGAGFYRTAFDDRSVTLLAGGIAHLSPEERLALLDNQWALARASKATVGQVLALVQGLGDEDDVEVLRVLAGILSWLAFHALGPATEPAFRSFADRLFRPQLDKLGWDVRPDDSPDEREKRQIVLAALGWSAGAADVRAEAGRRIAAHLAGTTRLDPEIAGSTAALAAANGDSALWDRYVTQMKQSQATDAQEEARFRAALCEFTDPELAARTADAIFSQLIRDQDRSLLISRLLGRPHGRAAGWAALAANWEEYIAPMDPGGKHRAITGTGQLTPRILVDEAIRFLIAHKTPDTAQTVAQAIERMRIGAANAERMADELSDALGRVAQPVR